MRRTPPAASIWSASSSWMMRKRVKISRAREITGAGSPGEFATDGTVLQGDAYISPTVNGASTKQNAVNALSTKLQSPYLPRDSSFFTGRTRETGEMLTAPDDLRKIALSVSEARPNIVSLEDEPYL